MGVGAAPLGAGELVVELRTVNQRHLEVRARAPAALADLLGPVEQLVREHVRRGRVDLALRHEAPETPAGPSLDRHKLGALAREVLAVRAELGLDPADLPVASVLAMSPEWLLASAWNTPLPDAREHALRATHDAIAALVESRSREGAVLAADLLARVGSVEQACLEVDALAGAHRERALARCRDRAEALAGQLPLAPSVDVGRLEAEFAQWVERADMTEELVRLRAHARELVNTIKNSGSTQVGRKLDFVLQEMAREATTLSAKCHDPALGKVIIDLRAEIDRMREQAQNIE